MVPSSFLTRPKLLGKQLLKSLDWHGHLPTYLIEDRKLASNYNSTCSPGNRDRWTFLVKSPHDGIKIKGGSSLACYPPLWVLPLDLALYLRMIFRLSTWTSVISSFYFPTYAPHQIEIYAENHDLIRSDHRCEAPQLPSSLLGNWPSYYQFGLPTALPTSRCMYVPAQVGTCIYTILLDGALTTRSYDLPG